MAKIGHIYCPKTADLRAKMHDGRDLEALRETRALLREGFASRPFLRFVADLLAPKPKDRGQPKRPPARWLDIGERYDQVYGDKREREHDPTKLSHQEALAALAKEFGVHENTIARAVKIYKAARDEHGELVGEALTTK
ncbi:hypothetical protein ILFOPFJJ_01472 [Ensifer psoraleae]|uniref:hypothetical protein n=1 Tax=Sinorhizobium psoraleae TaxID=520838 RepID=UPI001569BE47|nr:hypothetical protein [Sinorhizobium psoraleae]NRP70591.1 hypothetical protein [Sinorhizobium psoraleae]